MTESLKDMLEDRATAVAFQAPDLRAIARAGNRRIRRRRAVSVLATVTAVALAAGTAIALFGPASRRPPEVALGLGQIDEVSWALQSTIHDGQDTIDVGHRVRDYVRTAVGFVTLDDAGYVYSVTRRGVTRIGEAVAPSVHGTDHRRLVSDPRDTLAGWVEVDSARLVLRVHDQATGQTRTYPTDGAAPPDGAVFFAIDERTAYWRIATAGVFAVDLDTGDQRRLATADQARGLEIWSVEDGVLAFSQDHRSGDNVTSVRVGRSVEDSREFTVATDTEADDQMLLSPTGAWLSYLLYEFNGPPVRDEVRAFTAQVRDTGTGELVTLRLPPAAAAFPVVWLDDTTVQVLVLAPHQANMYRCTVPDGACAIAADLAVADIDGDNLVLPGGAGSVP